MNMLANLVGFKKKPKPEPERHEVSEYGEPVYQVTHRFSLDNYREYNDEVSRETYEVDKKIKKWGGIIMGVISLVFLILAIPRFDLFDYLDRGRSFFTWMSYSGFMFFFIIFVLAGYLSFHLLTFYKFFPKRLLKATEDYYNRTPYLTHDLSLYFYEDGVMEKAISRDGFFEWELFQRCWESENIVYLEFNRANQLFVSKKALAETGIDKDELMKFCNDHIAEARALAAEREAAEEAEEKAEEEEYEETKRQIEKLEAESAEEELEKDEIDELNADDID